MEKLQTLNHLLEDILSKRKYFSLVKQLGSRNPAKYKMEHFATRLNSLYTLATWQEFTATKQYIFIHKKLQGVLLETRYFLFDLALMFMLRHMHKLSFRRILIILLRTLYTHALIQNGRFNKDGQKNKREYINKPERNAYKEYLFHK